MMFRQMVMRGVLASGALLLLGSVSIEAQGVEAIMRARERLELTEEQVRQLDAIRREAVAQRTEEMARIAELRSQLEAGQIRRSELMAAMEDQRDARRARAEERRASIDALLTEAQRESLEQTRRRIDRQRPGAGARGRPGVGRGRPGFGAGPDVPGPRRGLAPRGAALIGSR
jgi:hypothetical protein